MECQIIPRHAGEMKPGPQVRAITVGPLNRPWPTGLSSGLPAVLTHAFRPALLSCPAFVLLFLDKVKEGAQS
jgi:hypothetical protein